MRIVRTGALVLLTGVSAVSAAAPLDAVAFTDRYCANCHNDEDKKGGLDLAALKFAPDDALNRALWVKVHDRLLAGEMPPPERTNRPEAAELASFVTGLATALTVAEKEIVAREGRATRRRLNGYEYENALRDLLSAPWLQVKGQFPVDGEAFHFNKVGDALDLSHVHVARYLSAADYALRQVLSVQFTRPPTETRRYYARDQRTITGKLAKNVFEALSDRETFPVLGQRAQPGLTRGGPLTVGDADPETRDLEGVGWVASNYMAGFRYRWDGFRAPVAGRYRIRFSGHTLWVASHAARARAEPVTAGRRDEPVAVYTRNGVSSRRVGEFDLTPEPAVHDVGEVWLLANETVVPDASRLFRSRPTKWTNPLQTPEGRPGIALRWMEVEGPLHDEATTAGYRLLFGDLPLVKASGRTPGLAIPFIDPAEPRPKTGEPAEPLREIAVEVVTENPRQDAERLLRAFLGRAYRQPVAEEDVQLFLALIAARLDAGLGFAEAMLAGYAAVLASPAFVFLDEQPGKLDDRALATRLALFLWNSLPDDALRTHAARGELSRPEVLRAETERMLADPKSRRFVEAFLDYWLDLRRIEDSTPSTTLYNDYYLDDALTEAAVAETQLYFAELVRRDLPARAVVNSDFTFLNERLAQHYGIAGVQGLAMRRVPLPPDSVRGGFMTQASVLKVTANGTTTSPVLRGKWIVERILGLEIPPPPPVAAVEPDIRGAVTIRQQLDKHRSDPSCASCHRKMDPPGFALESFDVMGGWRDRYRAVDEAVPPAKGLGKNGHPFAFHHGPPVDAAGELPDGRPFRGIRDFKRLLRDDDTLLARNLVRQLVVYATGSPVRFTDRPEIEKILAPAKAGDYGVRSLIHEIVQSELFREK